MQAANVSAKAYMDTWLLQINYPEISINLNNTGASSVLTFTQSRYTVTTIDEEYLFEPQISPFK